MEMHQPCAENERRELLCRCTFWGTKREKESSQKQHGAEQWKGKERHGMELLEQGQNYRQGQMMLER